MHYDTSELSWLLGNDTTTLSPEIPTLVMENRTYLNTVQYLLQTIGAKRKDQASVIVLTFIYCLIFLTGLFGNTCTCIVIIRNTYMHTTTNYYLLNLAISDVLTLIVALPPEMYAIWEAYPWRFGEAYCILKSYLSEVTYYSTVLTITAFTIERYIAICHPIRAQTVNTLTRAVRVIAATWVLAFLCALPYPIRTRLFHFVTDPISGHPIADSLLCNIPLQWQHEMKYVFQVSIFMFFVAPMTVISLMYVLIGMKLHRTEVFNGQAEMLAPVTTAATRARKAVLRMLVAVVVAFFLCWAPFHAQRLMTLYIKNEEWTDELLSLQSHIFYVSGVLYFFSSTINPILYSLMSRKFRQAFKRTLCRWCIHMEGLPSMYKVQAKLIVPNGKAESSRSAESPRCIYPDKPILLATFNNNNDARKQEFIGHRRCYHSSNDSYVKLSTRPTSSSGSSSAHAHSDGPLQFQCRHKSCFCKHNCINKNIKGKNPFVSRSFNNIVYYDMDSKSTGTSTRTSRGNGVAFDMSSVQTHDWRRSAEKLT